MVDLVALASVLRVTTKKEKKVVNFLGEEQCTQNPGYVYGAGMQISDRTYFLVSKT